MVICFILACLYTTLLIDKAIEWIHGKFAVELTTTEVFPLKDFTIYAWYIPSTELLCCTGFLNPLFITASVTEWDMGQVQFLIYFLKPLLNHWMESNHQYPTCWQTLIHWWLIHEATKSSNGAQLSITNLPACTKAMSNTQHRNSLSVTNKENISNKSGHSTTTLRKYLNTLIITKPYVAHMQSMTTDR